MKELDKDNLLDLIEDESEEEISNLTINDLLFAYSTLLLAVIIFAPKIYIKNNIYYTSRNIAQLEYKYEELKQENTLLKQKLQKLKFKNQTIDTIY